jgi:hypothetical protein
MDNHQERAGGPRHVQLATWQADGIRIFGGADSKTWRFRCARCGEVQSVAECVDAGISPEAAYQECIGRHVKSRGCDWALYGFLQIHTVAVVAQDGKAYPVFEFDEGQPHG